MVDVNFFVALLGGIIVLGFLSNKLFEKTKLPDVLFLIFFGLLVGPMLGLVPSTSLISLAPLIGTIAIIIIVLEGGVKLDFVELTHSLKESSWFTIVVCLLSAVLVALVATIGGWDPLHGLLLGFVLAGTSYEIIVPMLGKLPISDKAKTVLNLESALNDIVTVIPAIVLIQFLSAQRLNVNPFQALSAALGVGVLFGVLFGWGWVRVLKKIQDKPLAYLLTIAIAFLLYSIAQYAGGNGTTAIIVFGIILGNYALISKSFGFLDGFELSHAITSFQTEASFFVKTMFFVFMGVVFSLSAFNANVLGFAFVVFLALVIARFLSVTLLVKRNPALADSKPFLVALMPRGLFTAVLASLPIAAGITLPILEVTLAVIVLSNIFATGAVFYYSRKLGGKKVLELPALQKKIKKYKLFVHTQ